MEHFKKVSHRFRVLFQWFFYGIPFFVLWYWLVFHTQYDVFTKFGIMSSFSGDPITFNVASRVLGFIVTFIPAGIMMYGAHQMVKLFRNYEQGNIFVYNNVTRYRKLGYTLFAWVFAGFVYDALISLALTFQNQPGHRLISLSMNAPDIAALIAGGVIILIAWVMKEAYRLSKDQSLVI